MDKNLTPVISVVMPVYNCSKFVAEAVNSILNQTFSDFELIIIDDASTDSTVSIIREIDDNRIKIIKKKLNTGYTNSLNMGLKLSKGKYIARMDGDDICRADRFEKQVKYLDQNSNVAVCGSWYQLAGTDIVNKHPCASQDIKLGLLEGNCLGHPTVMFRKSAIEIYDIVYDTAMEPAEDYDLWVRIIGRAQIVNIPEVLLTYRLHVNQVSKVRETQQRAAAKKARIKLIGYLYDSNPLANITEEIKFGTDVKSNKEQLLMFIKEIQNAAILNADKQFFFMPGFQSFLNKQKRLAIHSFFKYPHTIGFKQLRLFLFSKNDFYRNFKNRDKIKVIFKSLFSRISKFTWQDNEVTAR